MKNPYLTGIFIFLSFFVLISCSNDMDFDSPKIEISDSNGNGDIFNSPVSAQGGTYSVSFTSNCAWYASADDGVQVSPESGKKGNNTISVVIPPNSDPAMGKSYSIDLYTSDNTFITSLDIEQGPAPYITCPESVEFTNLSSNRHFTIESNYDLNMTVAEIDSSWINASIEKVSNSKDSYELTVDVAQNPSLEERQGLITIHADYLTSQILVIQKGGAFLTYELFNSSGESMKDYVEWGYNFLIPPTAQEYTLKISSNCDWDYTIDNRFVSTPFDIKCIAKTPEMGEFKIGAPELAKDASKSTLRIIFKFTNGEQQEISIKQNNWELSVSCSANQKLSEQIAKLQSQLDAGYFITSITVDGGIIDMKAPLTVTTVTIKNVEEVYNGFCEGCTNLSTLNLVNVKRIGKDAFKECTSLNNFSLPATLEYIGDNAFMRYRAWYPYITSYNPEPPVLGNNVFHYMPGDGEVRVPSASETKYKSDPAWRSQFNRFVGF